MEAQVTSRKCLQTLSKPSAKIKGAPPIEPGEMTRYRTIFSLKALIICIIVITMIKQSNFFRPPFSLDTQKHVLISSGENHAQILIAKSDFLHVKKLKQLEI
jgi:hypothetical protein